MNKHVKLRTKVAFPRFTGVRVLMMPFHIHDPRGTLPDYLQQYTPMIEQIIGDDHHDTDEVGYLTVDEACVHAGEHHRRPGLHVDGVDEDGNFGAAWGGGGGGSWGSGGMYVGANVLGCRAWTGDLTGKPGPDGDCKHLKPAGEEILMRGDEIYWCSPSALHESLPMTVGVNRQFIRISMPNNCAWYKSCTPNPMGIRPTGRIKASRTKYMEHRP